jgi:hypothetical protein
MKKLMPNRDKVLHYIKNVLEVPRDEYDGMAVCPFAKNERETDNIFIDVIGDDSSFIECMNRFISSNKLDVNGFNARALAPCFLVLINDKKDIYFAHKKIKKTNYHNNMSEKYKKYLGL